MKLPILFSLLLLSGFTVAQDPVYTFDSAIAKVPENAFTNNARQYPKNGDFIIQGYYPMSTVKGQRAALVTIKNTSTGKRFFEPEHVMALFADGSRHSPLMGDDKYSLQASETFTLTLEFGRYDYPIVSVYTSNNKKE
ncbi:hypothetical protein PSECIP111951_00008 [Pseudoalteromonas holothuriae]|uniref:Uncharacterized protein n=1 Tax=Pseudoalteromonas holothuriae TaxID=2963714 RepID=A0A9W4QTZ2_9GAMM|nr:MULTISPECIES: hypothetical protein [unclassified Pseudoalteromonas]CAH9049713.1 hypothetical protein PSECIP111951_00008 [Pseudoalteromonas sp. CIP111951]CAH9053145.1 hypothetical protein PSECIP111854_01112 [Pseudoalteromonas sp. CIP111854]